MTIHYSSYTSFHCKIMNASKDIIYLRINIFIGNKPDTHITLVAYYTKVFNAILLHKIKCPIHDILLNLHISKIFCIKTSRCGFDQRPVKIE